MPSSARRDGQGQDEQHEHKQSLHKIMVTRVKIGTLVQCPPTGAVTFARKISSGCCSFRRWPVSAQSAVRARSPRLVALGVVQVLEPRIGARVSVVLKLALCFVLIGLQRRRIQQFLSGAVFAGDHRSNQLRIAGHGRHLARRLRGLPLIPGSWDQTSSFPRTRSLNWRCERCSCRWSAI